MKNQFVAKYLLYCSLLAPWVVCAQPTPAGSSAGQLQEPPAEQLNRFGLAFRMGFNITASFQNSGAFIPLGHVVKGQGFQPASPGPATGGGLNRTYEDGYNWVDSSGNNLGFTRYFGYDEGATQLTPNTLALHSTSSPGATSSSRDDDPLPGFEVTYNRELIRKEKWRAGLEAAFGYTPLSISDNQPLPATASQITDSYQVPPFGGGPIALPANGPYSGSFTADPNGNPVISDSPTRTVTALPAMITGSRKFDADLFGLRLGAYAEFPLSEKVGFNLSAGFALAYVNSQFSFQETTTVPGVGAFSSAGSSSQDGWLPGGYVAGAFSAEFAKDWSVFAGAQFEDVGRYTHSSAGAYQSAVLDLSQAVFVTIGVSHSF